MSRPAGIPLSLPAAIGETRRITLLSTADGTCRECGERIVRLSSGDWIHRGRVKGTPYGHAARARNGARRPAMVPQMPQDRPFIPGESQTARNGV